MQHLILFPYYGITRHVVFPIIVTCVFSMPLCVVHELEKYAVKHWYTDKMTGVVRSAPLDRARKRDKLAHESR